MSDTEQTGQATQADVSQQAQAATTQAQAASAEAESISLEEAKKLRQEAASLRRRTKELEAAEEQRQQASLSEQDKLKQQAAKLEAERNELVTSLRAERAKLAIAREAAKVGANPDLIAKLVTVEYDDAGQPVGVDKAVAALIKEHPYLVQSGTGAALGNGQRQSQQQQAETAEQRRARVYGAGGQVFDPNAARARGGGVVFPDTQE
jgi:hypothetical protein